MESTLADEWVKAKKEEKKKSRIFILYRTII